MPAQILFLSIKRIFDITNSTKERLNNGIKIIDQLFKEQVKLVDYILEFVSIDLILCLELILLQQHDYMSLN